MARSIGFPLLQSILLFYVALSIMRTSGAHRFLGNETDRLALLAFKEGIVQDPFQVMSLWNDSIHFCGWEGVTCGHRHQRVVTLNLTSKDLIGSVSPYIGNLTFLRVLYFRENSLQGNIPREVGRLSRLEILHLSNNYFTGQIPINLAHCTNLKILALQSNKLVGRIPEELGSFRKLFVMLLDHNNLTGGIPSILGNLSSLEFLNVGYNSLDGSIPSSLAQLKRLRFLSLGPNMLSGMVPPPLYNLSYLEVVGLVDNQLGGSLPPNIGIKFPNLREFLVGSNQLSGSIPVSLFTNASGLQKIGLGGNKFFGKVPIEVGSLKYLEYLSVEFNNFGSGGKDDDLNFVTALNNCSTLQMIDMRRNFFGGRLPNSIVNLSTTLEQLKLSENSIYGSIPSELGSLVNLILLSAFDNLLSGTIPKSIGMLQKMQQLVMWENRLSGTIPHSMGNMSQLFFLDLDKNSLQGNIITSLEKCPSLQVLDLSSNHLNGTIPKQVVGLSKQLTHINLAHNSLAGSLPREVGNLKNLQWLDISQNKISGEIPKTLGSCVSLVRLYMDGNLLQGPIPSSFSSLKGIQELDLSRNNLSGKILKDLGNFSFLSSLNLASNDFEGEVPINGVFQNASAVSIAGNKKLCGGIHALGLPKCHIKKSKGMSFSLKVTLCVLLPSLIIASFFLTLHLRKNPRTNTPPEKLLKNHFKRHSYGELCKATNGFSSENLLGMGSFGSVYKGVLHQEEGPIAVKVLNLMERGASRSFMVECEVLRKVRHRNLLKIITVCSSVDFEGNDFKALVLNYMPNGSIEKWLHPSSRENSHSRRLSFLQRLKITIDVASALDYLHNYSHTPIVHCDLKSSNVLLDDAMVAYVGDFGLAKFLPKITSNSDRSETNSVSIRGTIGYIPPEYGMGTEVSAQGDVYSYGILLLEMFTGKKPTDEMFKEGLTLHHYSKMAIPEQVMDIVDKSMFFKENPDEVTNDIEVQRCTMDRMKECLMSIIQIGVACSSESMNERLYMGDVITKLNLIMKQISEIRL